MNKLLSYILIGVHPNESNDLLNPSSLSRLSAAINVRFRLVEFMSVIYPDNNFMGLE